MRSGAGRSTRAYSPGEPPVRSRATPGCTCPVSPVSTPVHTVAIRPPPDRAGRRRPWAPASAHTTARPLPRARPAAGEPPVRSRAALCPSVSHRPGAVRNRPRGYPHSVPSFVPRPPHQPLPMVVHSPLWTTGLPDPGYPQGWAHPADPDQPAGYQPLPAPGACGKPAFPPLSQPVVRREHTSCGLPLPQRDRTSSSTAPLRRGTAPRHLTQEVVPTCGQLCGKTA